MINIAWLGNSVKEFWQVFNFAKNKYEKVVNVTPVNLDDRRKIIKSDTLVVHLNEFNLDELTKMYSHIREMDGIINVSIFFDNLDNNDETIEKLLYRQDFCTRNKEGFKKMIQQARIHILNIKNAKQWLKTIQSIAVDGPLILSMLDTNMKLAERGEVELLSTAEIIALCNRRLNNIRDETQTIKSIIRRLEGVTRK